VCGVIAGKSVPDAGSDVRAAGLHAPGLSDEKRPGRRRALLGVRGPVDDGRHPSGCAQGVQPGRTHKAQCRAPGHGVPCADYELAGLDAAERSLAVRVLGPNGARPHDAGAGQRRVQRRVHKHTAHAAVVHCNCGRPAEARSRDHVERGYPVSPAGGDFEKETGTPS